MDILKRKDNILESDFLRFATNIQRVNTYMLDTVTIKINIDLSLVDLNKIWILDRSILDKYLYISDFPKQDFVLKGMELKNDSITNENYKKSVELTYQIPTDDKASTATLIPPVDANTLTSQGEWRGSKLTTFGYPFQTFYVNNTTKTITE